MEFRSKTCIYFDRVGACDSGLRKLWYLTGHWPFLSWTEPDTVSFVSVILRLLSANMFSRYTQGASFLQRRKRSWWNYVKAPATLSLTARKHWRSLTMTSHRYSKPCNVISVFTHISFCRQLDLLGFWLGFGHFCLSSHWLFQFHCLQEPKQS